MTASVSQPLQLDQQPPLELDQPPASSQQQSEKHQTANTNKQQELKDLPVEQCHSISASNQQQSEPSNCLVTVNLLHFKLHSMYVYVSSVL